MKVEVFAAGLRWVALLHRVRGLGDEGRRSRQELIADWEATAQASQNRGLMDQLTDADKDSYVHWQKGRE